MPLSTEEDIRADEGKISDHFAYRVEGAHFWETQSPTFKFTHEDVQHFRFITGSTCLDVLASSAPVFSIVSMDAGPSQTSNWGATNVRG
jgi:hypothetical protein